MTARYAIATAIGVLVAAGVLLWWLAGPVPVAVPGLSLRAVAINELPGWDDDDHAAALRVFRFTCMRFDGWPDDRSVGGAAIGGQVGDWRAACAAAADIADGDGVAARKFFEHQFRAYAVRFDGSGDGLFTGYYEPLLHGSLTPDSRFHIPLYLRPHDLVTVDLGAFAPDLSGRTIAGRVESGRLRPYPDRAAIDAGALSGRGLEIVYVDDPVDAFFLHIQGSGVVRLPDGRDLQVGFAAKNGRPYFAIGRALVERGALKRDDVSMQTIRAWLAAHPDEAMAVMQRNASYVFFRPLSGAGPLGSLGVPLTPGRSIAVDSGYIPLGAPLWLDTMLPPADGDTDQIPLRRLMVAQDSGGAIRGGVRGDVFWGAGDDAARIAGRMKQSGRWYLLLPATLSSS